MNKAEFLSALRRRLYSLPPEEAERFIAYYSEMIDDRMEDGMTEEQAVASLEDLETIAAKILSESSARQTQPVAPRRKWGAGTILLLVLGSPVWLPLCVVFFVLLFVAYLMIWVAIILLYVVLLSLVVGGVVFVFTSPVYFAISLPNGLFLLGCGLISLALCLFAFFPVTAAAKALAKGAAWVFKAPVRWFRKRRSFQ